MEKKMTKKDYFNELLNIVENSESEIKGELIYFIENQITSIDNKAIKAKERAEAKKAEGDALREEVNALITNELQTADDIFTQLNGEDLTIAKVRARLTQLVNLGGVVKETIKTEDGKQKMAYRLAD